MALINEVPTSKVILPPSVINSANGRLTANQLRDPGDSRGQLALVFSYTIQAVLIAALADGIRFSSVGRYRTYNRQYSLFKERFQRIAWLGWRIRKFFEAVWWYLRKGMANAATPGTSNHGYGCADDICELDANGRVIGLTDRGLRWLWANQERFGIGLESHAERWHWHCRHQDHLTQGTLDVLRFVGIPVPEWMGGSGEIIDVPTDPDDPVWPPFEPPVVFPPVDLPNGVYGLTAYAISQMSPLPVLKYGDQWNDDPMHVQVVQAVIKFEASRFARWFLTIYSAEYANGGPRAEALLHTAAQATDMVVDGSYGPVTAQAVKWFQAAFGGEAWEGAGGVVVTVPYLTPDGVVGAQTWPFIFMLTGKEFVPF